MEFHGAKLAIISRDRILTILRDDIPTIPWPGYWDLPGGARENGETPETCALRETAEEVGVSLSEKELSWGHAWPSPPSAHWLFVAELDSFDPGRVAFGHEGQRWAWAPLYWYMTIARAIPSQRAGLRQYFQETAGRIA
ncbi:MAG: NUDIX hydrolase [Paracoccaceae bacterium]|nr:NUDIX hydrolase [Paracoccaceae bacterium]